MNWKDAERDELEEKIAILAGGLKAIEQVGGNLSVTRLLAIGGVNDGVSRANMVVTARDIASNALELAGFEPTRFNGG